MYHNYKEIFKDLIDVDAVIAEATEIAGNTPGIELVMALTVKAVAKKQQMQFDEFVQKIMIKAPTLQDLEDQGKIK